MHALQAIAADNGEQREIHAEVIDVPGDFELSGHASLEARTRELYNFCNKARYLRGTNVSAEEWFMPYAEGIPTGKEPRMPTYAALIYYPIELEEAPVTPEEMQNGIAEYRDFASRAAAAGVLAGGQELAESTTATTVHVEGAKGGKVVHTDGPFAETKEVFGGFFLLDCSDLDDALQWAAQIPGAWHGGKVEVRPLMVRPEDS